MKAPVEKAAVKLRNFKDGKQLIIKNIHYPRLKKIAVILLLSGLLILGLKQYFGYYFYYHYERIRSEARSIEASFPLLEKNLKRAIWLSKNPLFYRALARVYLERALGENESDRNDRRDLYCDLAVETLVEQINRNPIDPFAYYEMGKVYMLYNFPLLSYMDKGRLYMKQALEIRPDEEFLGLNIIYIFLTQWDFLGEEEKSFVFRQLNMKRKDKTLFLGQLYRRWMKNVGTDKKLREIISQDPNAWAAFHPLFID